MHEARKTNCRRLSSQFCDHTFFVFKLSVTWIHKLTYIKKNANVQIAVRFKTMNVDLLKCLTEISCWIYIRLIAWVTSWPPPLALFASLITKRLKSKNMGNKVFWCAEWAIQSGEVLKANKIDGQLRLRRDKFENATFFIRIGLPCPKMELFENALQSG